MSFLKLHGSPAISGEGATSFRCSACDALLFERVDERVVRGLKVGCPACAAISVV